MLKVKHVTKYYGDFCAVNDLSFEVAPGEILDYWVSMVPVKQPLFE